MGGSAIATGHTGHTGQGAGAEQIWAAAVFEAVGRTAQAVTSANNTAAASVRQGFMMQGSGDGTRRKEWWRGMWIFVLEAGVALGLLVFIVWWTWPRSEKKDDGEAK